MTSNFINSVMPEHLAFRRTNECLGISVYNGVMRCMPILRNGLQVHYKSTHMTLGTG